MPVAVYTLLNLGVNPCDADQLSLWQNQEVAADRDERRAAYHQWRRNSATFGSPPYDACLGGKLTAQRGSGGERLGEPPGGVILRNSTESKRHGRENSTVNGVVLRSATVPEEIKQGEIRIRSGRSHD